MKNVLLIDSGSGGVNILKECVRVCPFCNFLLFCDDKNLPYGSKSKQELQEITINNLREIKRFFDFQIVVLACNTLSCTCLDRVREEFFDTIFVGTVPAVKPALEKFDAKNVLVLATEATIRHNVLIGQNPHLQKLAIPWLASEIDAHLDDLEVLKPHLAKDLDRFLGGKEKPKAVVLGCTHYLAVRDVLQEILGEEVQFFDSANGVARRLKHFVLEEENSAEQSAKRNAAENEKNVLKNAKISLKNAKISLKNEENVLKKEENVLKKEENAANMPSYQVQIMVSGNLSALQSFWWWYEKE